MKVSVVTPSFNQGRFLERTLASVAIQGVELEHLVFDGGSTDESVDILGRAGDAVRWVSRKDGGQADAVNQGFDAASGEVVGWLNSDDVYYPGAVAAVVAYFDENPDVDVVYGDADHIDVEDRAIEPYPSEPWDPERLKDRCFICQPALFLRRRTIDRAGPLDANLRYCMDYEYWLRLADAGFRFAHLPTKLAGSRMYADNKTLGSRVAVHREINDMMKRLFDTVPDRWLFNYAHAVVERHLDRDANPKLFARRVGVRALAAALKWNRGVSRAMLSRIFEWLRSAQVSGAAEP